MKNDRTKALTTLILTIFLGWFGIYRLLKGQTGLFILWLLTCGLFGIGWIVDLILAIIDYLDVNNRTTIKPKNESNYKPTVTAYQNAPSNNQVNCDPKINNGTGNSVKGELLYENLKDYTVIDLETTSKYSDRANIIELAAVKIRNSTIVNTYDVLIKPPEPIESNITAITGITNEMVTSAPALEQKLEEYLNFIGDDIIIGHNIRSYDCNVINDACSRLNLKPLNNDMIDTLHYSHKCNIKVYNYRLATLARYFNIDYQAHRAINDCYANYNVYENLKRLYDGVYRKPLDRTKQSAINMKSCGINSNYSDLSGKSVVLTGDFEIAEIEDIERKIISLGAAIKRDVSGNTDYLIIGSLGHSQWYYGSYGRKIEKAIELQKKGKKVQMIDEWDFFTLK